VEYSTEVTGRKIMITRHRDPTTCPLLLRTEHSNNRNKVIRTISCVRTTIPLSSRHRQTTAGHKVDSMLSVAKVSASVGIDCALYISLVMF
jgi:uncharacterized protein YcsI (UPF0317 family)